MNYNTLNSLKRNYDIDHLDKFLDDNVVISDEVKAMSLEQMNTEIARLEAEAAKEKERLLKAKQKVS